MTMSRIQGQTQTFSNRRCKILEEKFPRKVVVWYLFSKHITNGALETKSRCAKKHILYIEIAPYDHK